MTEADRKKIEAAKVLIDQAAHRLEPPIVVPSAALWRLVDAAGLLSQIEGAEDNRWIGSRWCPTGRGFFLGQGEAMETRIREVRRYEKVQDE